MSVVVRPAGCNACRGLWVVGVVLFLGRLVAIELALNSAEPVGSGANQVSFYIFQFILIQFQLRLGQINLLLQRVPRVFIFHAGELLLQLVDPRVIGRDRGLGLIGSRK